MLLLIKNLSFRELKWKYFNNWIIIQCIFLVTVSIIIKFKLYTSCSVLYVYLNHLNLNNQIHGGLIFDAGILNWNEWVYYYVLNPYLDNETKAALKVHEK